MNDLIGIVEIAKGSTHKYEYDKKSNTLILDRVLHTPFPNNYGFIPNTLSEDDDALDVFILSDEPLVPLSKIKLELIDVCLVTDGGLNDHKLICRIKDDVTTGYTLYETEVVYFLQNYKKELVFQSLAGLEMAKQILRESYARYWNRSTV